MNEIFDVVDDADRVIGQASRAEVHATGRKHRAVHVFLFNLRGELFLQQRTAGKDTFPGCYDSSASGHLDAGETYDAGAVRELREELGIAVAPDALRRCFKVAACAATGQEFVWVYSLRGDYRPVINPAELAGGEFWPLAEVRRQIAAHPGQFAPAFVLIFQKWLSNFPAGAV
jgi:isopentenyl-diphosphate delta-isomerase type 1